MKMYKIISIIIILIFSMNMSSLSKESFNSDEVYKTIYELSSSKYSGRLAGEKGNLLTQNYIISKFKKYNLKPFYKNSYKQDFTLYVPTINGTCTFNVYNKNKKLIHKFNYGIDFKEVTYGASSSGTIIDKIRSSINKNANIKVIQEGEFGEENYNYISDYSLIKNGIKAVIYENYKIYPFRSPYKAQEAYSQGLIKIQVSKEASKKLKTFSKKDCYYEIKSPVNLKKVTVSNIIGKIEGSNKNLPPFILSAHFDHVGKDADGTLYPGALDNASGTAFLLGCAEYFKDIKPNRTIIFAAFNAEEEGLLGSMNFINNSNIKLTGSECINFDMVGSKKNIPITLLSSPNNRDCIKDIENTAKSLNIKTKTEFEDNSDHAPFCYNGILSFTLINSDTSKIHTPNDTMSNIDKNKFNTFFILVFKYMENKKVVDTSKPIVSNNLNKYIYISGILIISSAALFIIRRYKCKR